MIDNTRMNQKHDAYFNKSYLPHCAVKLVKTKLIWKQALILILLLYKLNCKNNSEMLKIDKINNIS